MSEPKEDSTIIEHANGTAPSPNSSQETPPADISEQEKDSSLNNQASTSNGSPTEMTQTESSAPTTSDADTPATTSNKDPDLFPCIENPLRFTLHCRNGYYLWGLRNGRVIARKKRSEKDEFRLNYLDADAGIVEVVSNKFGGVLTVVIDPVEGPKVVCVKEESNNAAEEAKEGDETVNFQSNANSQSENNSNTGEDAAAVDEEEFEDEPAVKIAANSTNQEDRHWCFVRGSQEEGVLLKSLRTGDNLAVDANGNVVLSSEEKPGLFISWDIECVSGELLFVSNPRLNKRIRCDMAGLLTLTDAWKGWEVFRVMETGSHHYVKISSWMHSQWFLCSTATGEVTCCSHSESLKENDSRGRCSQWAIEKSSEGEGVIIRSKTHARLLCVNDGTLMTYDPNSHDAGRDETAEVLLAAKAAEQQTASAAASKWWNNSVRSMNQSMRKVQKRLSQTTIQDGSEQEEVVVPPSETLVWQMEAAHSQTYYFLNIGANPKQPRSIGPFPFATANLRQTEKVQLKRTAQSTKLYLVEKEEYISCSPEGEIAAGPETDKNTEWVMEKPSYQEGGSVFRSKHYNFYLSYTLSNDGEEIVESVEPSTLESHGHFKNPFSSKSEPVAQLTGCETVGPREIWRLEPCMPRAVSSEKIKTFAIGTSIAVGTTIAMPFALAGASAVLGAVGAEAGVLFNAIAVGLTGAEALASVGAIGATAYIVFRPAENSLTDDHKRDDDEEGERAWSKRPFSNWRNW